MEPWRKSWLEVLRLLLAQGPNGLSAGELADSLGTLPMFAAPNIFSQQQRLGAELRQLAAQNQGAPGSTMRRTHWAL